MFKIFKQKSDTPSGLRSAGSKTKTQGKAAATPDKKAVKAELIRLGTHKAHGILVKPLVSEKTAHLGAVDTYGFVVGFKANKIEIAKAFQAMFGVKPIAVRIAIVPEKKKRRGRAWGSRSPWKKALIRVPKGSKVDIFTGV